MYIYKALYIYICIYIKPYIYICIYIKRYICIYIKRTHIYKALTVLIYMCVHVCSWDIHDMTSSWQKEHGHVTAHHYTDIYVCTCMCVGHT